MSYNSRIIREQGGSVLTIASGGSLTIDSGGLFTNSGALTLAGATTTTGTVSYSAGASVTVATGANFNFNGVEILTGRNAPAATASPGSLYLRSDGSMSKPYVNVSSGVSGSIWKGASIYTS